MIVGTEWLIEASGCDATRLRDIDVIRGIFERVIADLSLKTIDSIWHTFPNEGGVTALTALTESHLACHTYPEHGTATFNLYCCRTRPEWDWDGELSSALGAKNVSITRFERGVESNAGVPPAVLRPSRPQPFSNNGTENDRKLVSYGDVKIRERGRLPHWEQEDGIYFVTFRLADSLPQEILDLIEAERSHAEEVLKALGRELSHSEKQKIDWLFSKKVDEYLDANYGACHLRDNSAAAIVVNSLKHFDGIRYHLYAWCVMPNHVHVVFKPVSRNKLEDILHSWKSFSAHEINKILRRSGELWQREYYDHLVRSEKQLNAVVRYTVDNPVKARLENWPWVGSFRRHEVKQEI